MKKINLGIIGAGRVAGHHLKALKENNNFNVVNLTFNSPAEKRGMDFYDEITRIEISSVDRPAKEYVYLFAFVLLILLTYSQRRLSLRQKNKNNS